MTRGGSRGSPPPPEPAVVLSPSTLARSLLSFQSHRPTNRRHPSPGRYSRHRSASGSVAGASPSRRCSCRRLQLLRPPRLPPAPRLPLSSRGGSGMACFMTGWTRNGALASAASWTRMASRSTSNASAHSRVRRRGWWVVEALATLRARKRARSLSSTAHVRLTMLLPQEVFTHEGERWDARCCDKRWVESIRPPL